MSEAVASSEAGGPALSATWVWALTSAEANQVARFVAARRIRTVFLSVGRDGPETHVITAARRLRGAGVEVHTVSAVT